MNKADLPFYCLIQIHTAMRRPQLSGCVILRICTKHIRIFPNTTYICHSPEYVLFSLVQERFFSVKISWGSVLCVFKLIKCSEAGIFLQLLLPHFFFFSGKDSAFAASVWKDHYHHIPEFPEAWSCFYRYLKIPNESLLLLPTPKEQKRKIEEVWHSTWTKNVCDTTYVHFYNIALSNLDACLFSIHENRSSLSVTLRIS